MKPGRNEPCSCGSGKKFKHCCERKILPRATSTSPEQINQLVALFNNKRYAELESRARQLVEQHPHSAAGWKLLGASLHMQGKDGLSILRRTAELFPEDADTHNNLGNALKDREQFEDAIMSYRRALEIKPGFAMAFYNLGSAHHELGHVNEAMSCYRRSLALNPNHTEAYINLGNIYKDLGQIDDAEASYREALRIDPGNLLARSNLLFVMNHSSKYPENFRMDEALQYGRLVTSLANLPFSSWNCSPNPQRLRIGMVSADMYNHPVGYFLETLLRDLEYKHIELIAYPTSTKTDAFTTRLKPYFSSWKPLTGLNDADAAQLIKSDGIHVLLDLTGHTGNNRLPVFARKPAPVQVAWLGYLATTGMSEIDYLMADRVGVPEANHNQFTETLWYLPDTMLCFSPLDTNLQGSVLPAQVSGHITFGCYQNMGKVGDETFAIWSEILALLPDSRLRWQCKYLDEPSIVKKLIQHLTNLGINPEQISFHGAVSREAYLASHSEVDMLLDTFPYAGCTTTCGALWMGVPTLTLAGDTLLSRQGASILTAAGLADWVATSREDYVNKALNFAGNLPALSVLRAGLREQVLASPLFDAPRFARHFESALWEMWQARKSGVTHS